MSKIDEMYEAVLNNPVIIDDHNGKLMRINGVIELAHGGIAPLIFGCERYCLNELYTKDGALHYSIKSIGGVLRYADEDNIKDAIDYYNIETTRKSCRIVDFRML